ncbi:protein FAR1-RELATED SEQUENCE 5-like [Prunus dulcis]|uniref:protein FAR1-RELATED SEQUENCE 5-like n=1 Tax=Prunus dulcis TaxID=3755 RepID=UPI0014835D79|nr:protein FAR1-RELATED SEQUENCE 5-like [Prunus dulcis]
MEGSGKMDKGVETSKGGCSDSGYLGGCERLSDRAPAIESGQSQAVGMRRALVRTCYTYEYMVDQCGGYLNVDFQIKDLYNKLDASRKEILLDGDTEATLSYLKGKGAMDPEFFCKFSVDEENRLGNLFWRDSTSLLDYIAYGDVLIFDSTYKTNMYDKPLVLFISSNNYRSTVMFGCAFLHYETFEMYKWLLETFMASMKDKKPISILTDGDEAMRKAIDDVFPMSNHQLCSWHVSRNAQNNLKDDELLRNFQACIWEPFALGEFEKKWEVFRERRKVFRWYVPTQRVESMNKYVKDYLRKGEKLFECIPAIDRAMLCLRNTTAKDGFNAKYSTPVLKIALTKLEQQASLINVLTET